MNILMVVLLVLACGSGAEYGSETARDQETVHDSLSQESAPDVATSLIAAEEGDSGVVVQRSFKLFDRIQIGGQTFILNETPLSVVREIFGGSVRVGQLRHADRYICYVIRRPEEDPRWAVFESGPLGGPERVILDFQLTATGPPHSDCDELMLPGDGITIGGVIRLGMMRDSVRAVLGTPRAVPPGPPAYFETYVSPGPESEYFRRSEVLVDTADDRMQPYTLYNGAVAQFEKEVLVSVAIWKTETL